MSSLRLSALALLISSSCGTLLAQPQPRPEPASAAGAASAPAQPKAQAQAKPHVTVIEDDGARIEETRSGGVVRKLTVKSKIGDLAPYEIQLAPPGRDPNQERGNAGKRTWSLFDF